MEGKKKELYLLLKHTSMVTFRIQKFILSASLFHNFFIDRLVNGRKEERVVSPSQTYLHGHI